MNGLIDKHINEKSDRLISILNISTHIYIYMCVYIYIYMPHMHTHTYIYIYMHESGSWISSLSFHLLAWDSVLAQSFSKKMSAMSLLPQPNQPSEKSLRCGFWALAMVLSYWEKWNMAAWQQKWT